MYILLLKTELEESEVPRHAAGPTGWCHLHKDIPGSFDCLGKPGTPSGSYSKWGLSVASLKLPSQKDLGGVDILYSGGYAGFEEWPKPKGPYSPRPAETVQTEYVNRGAQIREARDLKQNSWREKPGHRS